jgi:hypothetical protein
MVALYLNFRNLQKQAGFVTWTNDLHSVGDILLLPSLKRFSISKAEFSSQKFYFQVYFIPLFRWYTNVDFLKINLY